MSLSFFHHPITQINRSSKALCQLVKIAVKKAGLFRTRCPSGCRSSTWDLSRPRYDFPLLPQKLLIKQKKALQFSLHFKMPNASLCLTRDRVAASSLSLSLITYRLRVMSDLISQEFFLVSSLIASKGRDSGLHADEPDGRWAILVWFSFNQSLYE